MLLDAALPRVTDPKELVSDAEVSQFLEKGYVLPKVGLPPEDAAAMRETIEQVVIDNPDWHGIVRMPHIPLREGQLEGVIGGEKLFRIAMHPTLIGAASRLVGPDLILWGGEIFAKPPKIGARTPWHQDCYTPSVKAGPGRERPLSAQIWIAVDNVDPSNGSLSFIPGSGRNGPIDHGQFNRTVKDLLNFEADTSKLDVGGAFHSVMKSGNFSAHDMFVVHGANANSSGRRRIGLTFHYMSARDLYDRSFGDGFGSGRAQPAPIARRPIWLVLGENRVPENDFVTGHQNLEELDAIAEETRARLTPLLV
jgi:hypothetical protein